MVTTQKVPTYYTWIIPWAKLPCSLNCQTDSEGLVNSKICPECRGVHFTQPLLRVLSTPCTNKGVDPGEHQDQCRMCRENRVPREEGDFAWRLWQWLQDNGYKVWLTTDIGKTSAWISNPTIADEMPSDDSIGDKPILAFLTAAHGALSDSNFKMEEPF